MKILLVSANDRPQGKPNLGLAYLASYLRTYSKKDLDIKILEYIPTNLKEISQFSPDLIGISAITPQFNTAKDFAAKIKGEMDTPIILGGVHISYVPESLPTSCDIGVIGEGEQTLLEIISVGDKGQINKIKGIIFREGKKIIKTGIKEKIYPLDKIPQPARDLLDMKRYLGTSNVFGPCFGRGTHMFTSRGCPYKCAFCSASKFWGGIRYFSPEYVLEEINELIQNYRVKLIQIYDDLFVSDKKRIEKIANLICKSGINKEVEFGIYARANLFDREICENLKKMNVTSVEFGIESGQQRILNFLKKNTLTVEQVAKAVKLAKKYGFFVGGSFIIGSPEETEKDMLKTLEFAKDLKLNKFAHFIATPYPGTDLWELAKKEGKIKEKYAFFDNLKIKEIGGKLEEEDFEGKKILLTNEISVKKFVEIYKMFEKERLKLFGYRWDENKKLAGIQY